MKRTNLFSLVLFLFSVTLISQVPKPRSTNKTISHSTSGAKWTKTNDTVFSLKDKNGNLLSNTKELIYMNTDTLAVMEINNRDIYLLADFENANAGDEGNAVVLARNLSKDYFITNKYSFGTYVNDELYLGSFVNVEGSYVNYIEELDATYYFDGIRNFDNWGAKDISKLEYSSNNTYWYRDVENSSYGVIVNGEVINYDEATTIKDGNDLIVSINDVKTYTLPGYYSMASFVFKPVEMYIDSSSSTTTGCVSGNCKDGWGKYDYGNGYYEGFWSESKRNDYGMYNWDDSGKYIGNWEDDTMTGYGIYIAENNDNIIGNYKNGELNGPGLSVYGEEWTYGIYKDGEITTTYNFYSNEGDTGCVAGDCQNQYGRWKWDTGDTFTGFFKNGQFQMGTYQFTNGDRYTGLFNEKNQFHGMGRYFYEGGGYYGGEWINGEMGGKGYYHDKDLVRQVGDWTKGSLTKSYLD